MNKNKCNDDLKNARCVIVSAAKINSYDRIKKEYLNENLVKNDFYIFCDAGLYHKENLGISPSLIVGDFDSHPMPEFSQNVGARVIRLPREKDDTDTVYAVKKALKMGFRKFLLLGVIGQRFDHSMGNIGTLFMINNSGAEAVIVDDYSEIKLITTKKAELVSDAFEYFSLVNVSGVARGIDIKNAKYLLQEGEIKCDYQYGISNEVLQGKVAEISIKEGALLLVKVFRQSRNI